MNTSEKAKNKANEQEVSIIMVQTAYKLYKMQAVSSTKPEEFTLATEAKAIWMDPLIKIYEVAQKQSMNGITSHSISKLCNKLAMYDHGLRNRLRKKVKDKQKELIRKIQIIYYSIVFDISFRNKVFAMFESKHLDKDIISLDTNGAGARITLGLLVYPGNTCIECNKTLSNLFRSCQKDAKGSVAMVYHKHESPKICNVYQKKCSACDIYYNYNRIDYSKKTKCKGKINQTIFLDPAAFPYFSMARKSNNFIHQSIFKSIRNYQYCNKSTSIEIWLQHFNEEWTAEYEELYNITQTDSLSIKLGYSTILRYFYFHSLLYKIRDIENYNPVNVNGRDIKIALILSNRDKVEMLKEQQLLMEAKGNNETKQQTTDVKSHHFFKYCVNKYYQQLITSEVSALKQVPVRINKDGKIEIHPGWFVLYGDGGEKISRLRCAYPAILSKYDYMMEIADNEEKVNEIGEDDNDIDLAINYNSRLYSSKRYYECDNTPYCNDPDNNKKSYKCCKYHTAQLITTHSMELNDIPQFTTWYQLHSAVARINNTNVQQTLQAHYTVDEEVVTSITTKHKKKHTELQNKIAKFIQKYPEKHLKFKKFIEQIHYKMNSWKQKSRPKRVSAERGRAKVAEQCNELAQQQIYETITDILGDDDIEDINPYNIQTSVGDLLELEFNNNNYLDKHEGCRKSKFISQATTARTKGLNVLMNTAGIMVTLREEIVRETPTAVILDIANSCTNNAASIQYANRIEAIGYDMMCRIYYHLKTLIDNDRLPAAHKALWCELIPRSFIDIWHIFTHTDELCKENGIFHPKLKKFEEILFNINEKINRINDIIAEQFWSTMNATNQLKSMNKETFLVFLLDKRSYYNQRKIDEIKQKGWTFIPIEWCSSLRNIESGEAKSLSSKEDLQRNRRAELERISIKPTKVRAVKDKIFKAAGKAINDDGANIGDKRNRSLINDSNDEDNMNKKRKLK